MVCSSWVRSLVVQAGSFAKRVNSIGGRSLQQVSRITYPPNREFRAITRMMVDTGSGSMSKAGLLVDNMMTEKDDDGRFASGGWKR